MFVNTREGICEGLFFFVYSPSVIVVLFRGTAVYRGLRKHDTIALDFVVAITTVAALGYFFFFLAILVVMKIRKKKERVTDKQ